MSSALNTIQAANNGITSITKLVQSAQALVPRRSRPPTPRSGPALPPSSARFGQIDQLAGDPGFNGINLLDSTTSTDLTVTLNKSGSSSVTVAAVDFSSAGDLSLNAAANNWGGTADITAASTDLTAALSTLRSQAQAFGSNLSTVQIRQDFTKAMINTLQTGSDALTLADSNEEGANLLALQTRQQLSTTALSLASQASQAVLRLF